MARFLAATLAVVLLAIVFGRLVIKGPETWGLAAVVGVFVAVLLVAVLDWRGAAVLMTLFVSLSLLVRFVVDSSGGWAILLLAPVGALTVGITVRVLRRMGKPVPSVRPSGGQTDAAAAEGAPSGDVQPPER